MGGTSWGQPAGLSVVSHDSGAPSRFDPSRGAVGCHRGARTVWRAGSIEVAKRHLGGPGQIVGHPGSSRPR